MRAAWCLVSETESLLALIERHGRSKSIQSRLRQSGPSGCAVHRKSSFIYQAIRFSQELNAFSVSADIVADCTDYFSFNTEVNRVVLEVKGAGLTANLVFVNVMP